MWCLVVKLYDQTIAMLLFDRVNVAIIREGYVPDDDIDLCIEKINSIPGMKFDSKSEISFEYTVKANTNALIEMAVIPFTHTRKK